MQIGVFRHTVELQVGITETCFGRGPGKLGALGKFNPVGGDLNDFVSDFARVANGVKEMCR